MKKLLLLSAAACALGTAGPSLAADLPINAVKATVPIPAFTWTSCYAGGHAGGGWVSKDVTDPVQLVQDSFLGLGTTVGVTTTSLSPAGLVIGGQFGCDYQFGTSWVVGIEGAASGSTMKGSTSVALPLGNPGEAALVTARTDFLPSATARLGYAADRWLFYVKGGAAWAGDKYDVSGTFMGTPFGFEGLDFRTGWTAGGGVEWAFSGVWSAKLEYDYYEFGHGNVLMSDNVNVLSGPLDFKQSIQIVKVGLNFHMWGGQ
jgi:outer membrane immunogenic protein